MLVLHGSLPDDKHHRQRANWDGLARGPLTRLCSCSAAPSGSWSRRACPDRLETHGVRQEQGMGPRDR